MYLEIVAEKHWETVEFATKVRSISCKMPLPAILVHSDDLVSAQLCETVVVDEVMKK